jgi:hypothetical protein
MLKQKTHYEQISLGKIKKIVEAQNNLASDGLGEPGKKLEKNGSRAAKANGRGAK